MVSIRYGSGVVLAKRKPKVTEPRKMRPTPQRPTIPFAALFRMFVLGAVAVVASAYAIYRHYTVPPMKMLVPVPSTSASEIEIETTP